jgi:hypothetical protein
MVIARYRHSVPLSTIAEPTRADAHAHHGAVTKNLVGLARSQILIRTNAVACVKKTVRRTPTPRPVNRASRSAAPQAQAASKPRITPVYDPIPVKYRILVLY